VTGSPDYSIGASVSFNIFNAGHNARVAEARHLESVVAAQNEETRRQIRLDVLRARQQWLTAGEQVRIARAGVGQAAEVLRVTENRYEAGLETITPLLRAQTDLVRAQMNLVASENAYAIGYAGILLVTGTLTDVNAFSGSEAQQ
jgi:outer membrane protein TolC